MKMYLISYKPTKFQALNSLGFEYELEVEVFMFFGLIKKRKTINYEVPYTSNLKQYIDNWEFLIKERKVVT